MDYSKILATRAFGERVGAAYMDAKEVHTSTVRVAYREFGRQILAQFDALPVRVEFQAEDPYESAEQMFDDVRESGRLKIYQTAADQAHPLMSNYLNDRFRAVHDYHGHFMTGRDFSRHGEEAAWWRHSQMFTGLARRAMTSETRGQSSAFIWINGGREFPPQKAVLLPSWVMDTPPAVSE